MAKKAAEKEKSARREKGPLETPLEPIPLGPGLLYDSRPARLVERVNKVVAFAEQAGINPKAEDVWFQLAWYLLQKHEPAFRPEPRGRNAADRSHVRTARRELIELYTAENAARIAKGLKQLSDKAFVEKLLAHAGRSKLPPYYQAKPKVGERLLRQELMFARGELALSPDVQSDLMEQYGFNELGLGEAANFAALHRPKRAGQKVGRK